MVENILTAILRQELQPDLLFHWISGENQQRTAKFQFCCGVGEFASYFLNYIHEDGPSYDDESSNRMGFTPKGIRSLDRDKRNANSRPTAVKRRPALFTDPKNDQKLLHSQTFPVVTSKLDATNKHQPDELKHSNETSTPKLMKINSDSGLDNSYASPTSPLYTRNNLNTPRNRNSEKNLCLGDFIVQKKSSSKKKAQRSLCDVTNESKKFRRINPTNLNEKRFSSGFKETGNSFNFNNDFVELAVENLNDQRNLLAEERLKIKSNIDDLVKTTNILKLQSFNGKTEVIPSLDKVKYTLQLDNLIRIYDFLLINDFVLNLTSEVHFLISLLLSRQYSSENLNDSDSEVQIIADIPEDRRDIFKTVHNCVYFAIGALRTQSNVLRCLDRPTLKLLYENERIKSFSREFHEELLTIYHSKSERMTEYVGTMQSNVCFMSDTDNRENFPTDASFHAFRKQRDLFYEILRIWEQNHYLSGWNFPMALGGKIKTLLSLHGDPVNYRHFARLFKMQLLASCRQTNNEQAISEEQAHSILTTIPNVNADKLHRLKTRLTTKQDHIDLNSAPTFVGQQEFYKDFILTSWTCHNFLRHLQDSLVSEILRINENIFEDLSENEENNVNFATRNTYFASMKNLRILAKFLGFIESFPYKMDVRVMTEKVLRAEIETRKWYCTPIDLKSLLAKSLENKTLIVTIPWMCKYIAMLDYVTVRLPYLNDVIKILVEIYRSVDVQRKDTRPIYNWGLIRLSLGWLFELTHFPSECYFRFVSKSNFSNIKIFDGCELDEISSKRQKRLCLDELDVVDQTILSTFCPYLEGFRKLLLSTNTSNAGNGVKHITPLTAVENSNDLSEKKLKNQLEEAFFNCQPISVRKTVEFISERVASSCVKHICNKIVPEYKKTALERAKNILERISDIYACDEEIESKLECILKNQINELSVIYLKELQEMCAKETEKLTSERIPLTLNALLAVDDLEQTKETCVAITKRLCIDRVQQWVDSHVNIGLFNKFKTLHMEILKSLEYSDREAREKPVFQLPGCGRDIEHNFDSLNAVKVVEIIRKITIDLIESKPVHNTTIPDLINSIRITATERCDVNNQILTLINRMLVDLMLIIITHKLEYFNDNLQPFINHWKMFIKPNEDHFKTIICPRNVMLIGQSKDVSRSWSYLSRFIVELLEIDLLNCETFESQCISIYQREWDEGTLKHLSTCFRDVIDDFQRKKPDAEQFSSLLGFVSSYCSEMEF